MTTSPISLESIKFHLVWNKEFTFNRENQTVSLEELIEFLIESLEDADKVNANKAENLLTRIGKPAVPYLIQGLKSAHNQVKSVCAMSLIRIGQPALEELKEFYIRHYSRAKIRWVAEFILAELGADLVTLEAQAQECQPASQPSGNVLQLSKAG